jgi:hypothetical protein
MDLVNWLVITDFLEIINIVLLRGAMEVVYRSNEYVKHWFGKGGGANEFIWLRRRTSSEHTN